MIIAEGKVDFPIIDKDKCFISSSIMNVIDAIRFSYEPIRRGRRSLIILINDDALDQNQYSIPRTLEEYFQKLYSTKRNEFEYWYKVGLEILNLNPEEFSPMKIDKEEKRKIKIATLGYYITHGLAYKAENFRNGYLTSAMFQRVIKNDHPYSELFEGYSSAQVAEKVAGIILDILTEQYKVKLDHLPNVQIKTLPLSSDPIYLDLGQESFKTLNDRLYHILQFINNLNKMAGVQEEYKFTGLPFIFNYNGFLNSSNTLDKYKDKGIRLKIGFRGGFPLYIYELGMEELQPIIAKGLYPKYPLLGIMQSFPFDISTADIIDPKRFEAILERTRTFLSTIPEIAFVEGEDIEGGVNAATGGLNERILKYFADTGEIEYIRVYSHRREEIEREFLRRISYLRKLPSLEVYLGELVMAMKNYPYVKI